MEHGDITKTWYAYTPPQRRRSDTDDEDVIDGDFLSGRR